MLPIELPSDEALACLTGLYHGDRIDTRDGVLVIVLDKALLHPPLPGQNTEQIVNGHVLDELEGRGWIDLACEPPAITQSGRYWLRRYADKTLGKRFEPAIILPNPR